MHINYQEEYRKNHLDKKEEKKMAYSRFLIILEQPSVTQTSNAKCFISPVSKDSSSLF